METKTSFPLKKKQHDVSEDQIQETKKLIYSIIQIRKFFFEITINKQKKIQKIHILFYYMILYYKQMKTNYIKKIK